MHRVDIMPWWSRSPYQLFKTVGTTKLSYLSQTSAQFRKHHGGRTNEWSPWSPKILDEPTPKSQPRFFGHSGRTYTIQTLGDPPPYPLPPSHDLCFVPNPSPRHHGLSRIFRILLSFLLAYLLVSPLCTWKMWIRMAPARLRRISSLLGVFKS